MGQAFKRLQELARRDHHNALYQGVLARYTGDFEPAIDACLSDHDTEWVEAEDSPQFQIEKIFACDLIVQNQFSGFVAE